MLISVDDVCNGLLRVARLGILSKGPGNFSIKLMGFYLGLNFSEGNL